MAQMSTSAKQTWMTVAMTPSAVTRRAASRVHVSQDTPEMDRLVQVSLSSVYVYVSGIVVLKNVFRLCIHLPLPQSIMLSERSDEKCGSCGGSKFRPSH